MKRLFRGSRRIVIYEDVEVFADTYNEAVEMIEDDDEDITIIRERDGDYELDGNLIEVKE